MPNQPGSAPSKRDDDEDPPRPSAASVLDLFSRPMWSDLFSGFEEGSLETVRVALRVLVRLEREDAEDMADEARYVREDASQHMGDLLSDLAALVAPTDAEGK